MLRDSSEPTVNPVAQALERAVEASVEQLLQGSTGPPENALLFLSAWHEAMPALVHLDPVLDPVDSRVFAVLWLWGKQQGRGSTVFPSYDYLLQRCNVRARATVARSLAILRLTRWVTLCRRVRDGHGRYRGSIYALHDEPLALAGTLHLDPDYMAFLHTSTEHRHAHVRQVALTVLDSLQARMQAGEDVLAASPITQAEQRLEAWATVAGRGSGHYFGLHRRALSALQGWRAKRTQDRAARPATTRGPDQAQGSGMDRVQSVSSDPVQKVNSDQVQKINLVDNALEIKAVQNVNSALCSSSYINIKPTTTTSSRDRRDRPPGASQTSAAGLLFPDTLSANEQRLARMYLEGLEPPLQQGLLDELGEKILTLARTEHRVRNPIGLLAWMCQEARAGRPPLTSAHLQCRERREREQRLHERIQAEQRRLTETARQRRNPLAQPHGGTGIATGRPWLRRLRAALSQSRPARPPRHDETALGDSAAPAATSTYGTA